MAIKKTMSNRDSAVLFYGGTLGLIAAIWGAGNMVNQKLSALDVLKLKRVQSQQVSTDTKAFYPVWVKQKAAIRAEQKAENSLDSLFKRPEEPKPVELPKPPEPPEPNYAQLIQQSVFVSAIADNGAVINGRFYAVGDKVDDLTFMPPGKAPIAPMLVAVKGDVATISIAKKSVVIRMASNN